MRLAIQRLNSSKGLILAAAIVTVIATTFVTALATFARDVTAAGAKSVIASAAPEERSLLVRGAAGDTAATAASRDAAVRSRFSSGLAGVSARVWSARYATGTQLTGQIGDATRDAHGMAFASIAFLDGVEAHADLVAGRWPAPAAALAGDAPPRAALAEPASRILGVRVGDRVPVTDRFTGATTDLLVVGVWRARDPTDPYWRLAPAATSGAVAGTATYGPFVVAREDFLARYGRAASLGWLIEPDLRRADPDRLATIARAVVATAGSLPRDTGLGSSATVETGIDRLSDRLNRADLAGRSALVTPILLTTALGGYALLAVALLLMAHRRGETALLRARGAGRRRLVALALAEAALVVTPAVLVAPALSKWLRGRAGALGSLAGGALATDTGIGGLAWISAACCGAGCLLAMSAPWLRSGGPGGTDQAAAGGRPDRRNAIQRAGVDAVLVAFAVLGWYQLRRYSSPVTRAGSGLGVDPLLAATPVIAVLAGATLALRPLAPAAARLERLVDRRPWPAATLGVWQASRRPYAGSVPLLALAVAASTLAWCLAATSRASLIDHAEHLAGADVRLVETHGVAANDRVASPPRPPGARVTLPVSRDTTRAGPRDTEIAVVSIDAATADQAVRLREDLADEAGGSARAAFARLADARAERGLLALPPKTRRLTGAITASTSGGAAGSVRTEAILATADGRYLRLPLAESPPGAESRFAVELPTVAEPPAPTGRRPALGLRLAGFRVTAGAPEEATVTWNLRELAAWTDGGGASLLALGGGEAWRPLGRAPGAGDTAPGAATIGTDGSSLRVTSPGGVAPPSAASTPARELLVGRTIAGTPVPALVTPAARRALRPDARGVATVELSAASVRIRVVGTLAAVPTVGDRDAALLLDLPSLNVQLFSAGDPAPPVSEWLIAARAGSEIDVAHPPPGLSVHSAQSLAATSRGAPHGVGARAALFAAALGSVLLAGAGIAFDAWATTRRRTAELAVLNTIGAGPGLLARAVVAERLLLAAIGVLVGLLVGIAVAAAMAPLIILTPAATQPVPPPRLVVAWAPVLASAGGLFTLAGALGGLVAVAARRRLVAARSRIGVDPMGLDR